MVLYGTCSILAYSCIKKKQTTTKYWEMHLLLKYLYQNWYGTVLGYIFRFFDLTIDLATAPKVSGYLELFWYFILLTYCRNTIIESTQIYEINTVFLNKNTDTCTLLYLYHRCGICQSSGTSHRSIYEKYSVPSLSYKFLVE